MSKSERPEVPPNEGTIGLAELARSVAHLTQQVDQLRKFLEGSPGVRSIYVEENTAMARLTGGQKIYVDSRDGGIASHIMASGIWEPHNTREIRRLLEKGHTAIDIGANFGYYSILFSSIVSREGKVFSFEPNPRLYRLLIRSLEVNGYLKGNFATPFSCALSDHAGRGELSFREGNFGGGTLFANEVARRERSLSTVDVELRTLDSIPIPRDRPTLIKIDTEGAEYSVLKGATKTLNEIDDVIVMLEFFPAFIKRHLPVDSYVDFLSGLGFSFFDVNNQGLVALSKDDIVRKSNGYVFLARRDISS